jgi:hypothetical protein
MYVKVRIRCTSDGQPLSTRATHFADGRTIGAARVQRRTLKIHGESLRRVCGLHRKGPASSVLVRMTAPGRPTTGGRDHERA